VYRIFDSAWTQRTDGVSGRISRAKYWLAAVIYIAIYIAIMVVLGGLAYELDIAEEMPAISIVLAVIIYIPVVISGIFTYAALVGAAMCSAFKCGTRGRWP
jgi:uncharacterized membrane protein YhaH (DUF805 family)